ncbi:hypothetical protein CHS0354_004757 [Potamilus streckersoni]|uniref:Protein-lysine N-methyltransferase CHS0354_004757 n=2 Tax=Potamilus streckersoni TaxID=2493646 RepID=A0AAE0WB45_9BIVA|nr:hypothetical protein CHS0354_004757 [Potamilus streckersoni]
MNDEGDRDFESSDLGTKDFWDNTYSREVENFKDHGDVGEIWFGEDTQEKICDWIEEGEGIEKTSSIIDLGCGNGMMLINLWKRGFRNLTGVDYSEGAITLAKSLSEAEGTNEIVYLVGDLVDERGKSQCSCLRHHYKVCVDKGTYDAVSLMPEHCFKGREQYRDTIKSIMEPDGYFIITSCNWTKDQLLTFFGTDFLVHDEILYPTFQFGGKTGSKVTSLIMKLKS